MGVIDRFLNAMKLNDEEGFGEDDYLDEDYEEEEQDVQPKKHILKKFEEEEDTDEYIPQPSAVSSERTSATKTPKPKVVRTNPSSKISPMRQKKSGTEKNGEMEVCIIKPRSMEDAREITEMLLQDCTVVLNLEGLDLDLSQRVIDYSSGSCYAVGGNLQRVSSYIFIITPAGVSISGDFQEILNGAVDIPAAGARFQ